MFQRRSAVAERIRLREEWSALKGPEAAAIRHKQVPKVTGKKTQNTKNINIVKNTGKSVVRLFLC